MVTKEVTIQKAENGLIWIEDGKTRLVTDQAIGGAFYEVVRVLAARMGAKGHWNSSSL